MCSYQDAVNAMLANGAVFGYVQEPVARKRGHQHELLIKFLLIGVAEGSGDRVRRHFQVSVTSIKKDDMDVQTVSLDDIKKETGFIQQSLHTKYSFFLLSADMDVARVCITAKTLLGVAYSEFFPSECGTVREEVKQQRLPHFVGHGERAPSRKNAAKRARIVSLAVRSR